MKRQRFTCTNEKCPNIYHFSATCPNSPAVDTSTVTSTTENLATPPESKIKNTPSLSPLASAVQKLRAGTGDRTTVRIPIEGLGVEKATAAGRKITHLEVDVYYSKGGTNHLRGVEEKRGYYISVQPVRIEDGIVEMIPTKGEKRLLEEAGRKSKGKQRTALGKVAPPLVESMITNLEGLRRKEFSLPEGFVVEEQWRIPKGHDRLFTDIYDSEPGSQEIDQLGRMTALNLGYPVGHRQGSSIQHIALGNGKTVGLGGQSGEEVTHLHLTGTSGELEHTFTLEGDMNSSDLVELSLKAAENDDPSSVIESQLGEWGYKMTRNEHTKSFTHDDLEGAFRFA